MLAVCGVPADAAIEAGSPGVLVSRNVAGVATPVTVAVMTKFPAMLFAVNAGAVATPCAFVVTVALAPNVPPAPAAGAVKVTVAPLTRFPATSVTVA